MLLGHLGFAPSLWGGSIQTSGAVAFNEAAGETAAKIAPVVKKWDFNLGDDSTGLFVSSPLVHGDRVYAAYSETVPKKATLVCLDRHTGLDHRVGKKKWRFFGKNNDLVQMISTPCLADGKLYFGEGFHDDENCKVYCVDAAT